MLQDPQVLGNDHNKPHSLMSDPISTMYFHNMFCDLLNKILFKPKMAWPRGGVNLNKLGRGPLADATYQISRLQAFWFETRFFKFSSRKSIFSLCDLDMEGTRTI